MDLRAVAGAEPTEVTLGDLVVQVQRIADLLEAQQGTCGEAYGAARCTLLPSHKGFHITADGRTHWLED